MTCKHCGLPLGPHCVDVPDHLPDAGIYHASCYYAHYIQKPDHTLGYVVLFMALALALKAVISIWTFFRGG